MVLLFVILIGCDFFSCVENIVCSSDLGGGGGARINWHMKVYDVAFHSTYMINNYERYLLEHTSKMIINIQVCFFTRNGSHKENF